MLDLCVLCFLSSRRLDTICALVTGVHTFALPIFTILALSLLRLAWRLSHRPPPLPAAMPGWQVLAARATHLFFYVAMIALPLTGWLTASASPPRFPLESFGMFQLPFLPVEPSRSATGLWSEAHERLAFSTLAEIGRTSRR